MAGLYSRWEEEQPDKEGSYSVLLVLSHNPDERNLVGCRILGLFCVGYVTCYLNRKEGNAGGRDRKNWVLVPPSGRINGAPGRD